MKVWVARRSQQVARLQRPSPGEGSTTVKAEGDMGPYTRAVPTCVASVLSQEEIPVSFLARVLTSKNPSAPWLPPDFSCFATLPWNGLLWSHSSSHCPVSLPYSALGSAELKALFTVLSTQKETHLHSSRLPAFSGPHSLLLMTLYTLYRKGLVCVRGPLFPCCRSESVKG